MMTIGSTGGLRWTGHTQRDNIYEQETSPKPGLKSREGLNGVIKLIIPPQKRTIPVFLSVYLACNFNFF